MFGAAHRSAWISLQRGGRRRDREMFRRGARCLIIRNGLRVAYGTEWDVCAAGGPVQSMQRIQNRRMNTAEYD